MPAPRTAGVDRSVKRVRRHVVPAWWRDAKLGIFVHWTPASVAGFAPTDEAIGPLLAAGRRDALGWSPYTEWYENSLRFPGSPVAQHHRATYGERPYREFAREWEAALEEWEPDEWARRFAATGARYVVLVAKHHDGYCLWPSAVRNPNVAGFGCARDVVGELAEAVRGAGLRFGVYYSGGLDWTFDAHPIGTMSDLLAAQPRGDYPAYAEAHVRELIARYRPSVLWNDISWPASTTALAGLLAHYYDAVPDGVVNDRFMTRSALWSVASTRPARTLLDKAAAKGAQRDRGIVPPKPPLFDVRTPEYTTFDSIQSTPWECVRGMDKSFGYNRMSTADDFLTRRDLLWSVADIAAKNGNLLLNVGPRGEDAQIPEPQLERLDALARWTSGVADALFATRPWVVPGTMTADGAFDVRYTARDRDVFAFVRRAGGRAASRSIVLPELDAAATTEVRAVADDAPLRFTAGEGGLRVELTADVADDPVALRVRDGVARG